MLFFRGSNRRCINKQHGFCFFLIQGYKFASVKTRKLKQSTMRTPNESFDGSAFYERYYEAAVRYALTFLSDEEEARDAVGDTMLRLIEMQERLDGGRSVRALFFSMVHNRCMDLLRRRQCYRAMEAYLARTANHYSDDELTCLCQRELFRIVGSVINEMPEKERVVFQSVRMEGMCHKKVAEETGLSCRGVEYRVRRSVDRIKDRLMQMYG